MTTQLAILKSRAVGSGGRMVRPRSWMSRMMVTDARNGTVFGFGITLMLLNVRKQSRNQWHQLHQEKAKIDILLTARYLVRQYRLRPLLLMQVGGPRCVSKTVGGSWFAQKELMLGRSFGSRIWLGQYRKTTYTKLGEVSIEAMVITTDLKALAGGKS